MSKILFCKSKVFLHPTSDARDNVAGFLLLTLEPNKQPHQTILQYVPEASLSSSEISKLLKHESEVGVCPTSTSFVVENSMNLSNLINTASSGQAFEISLSQVYCIQFRPPSPNGWFVGSLVIYPLTEQFTGFQPPVLFFHDQLCPSTTDKLKRLRKSMNPFDDSDELYWGGVDLRNRINKLMEVKKSNLEPEFWLVNPTLNDLRNFVSKDLLESYNNQNKTTNESAATAGGKLNEKLQEWKWSVMSKIADVTTKSTNFIDSWLNNNTTLQKSQIDNEYLQTLLNNEKVKQIEQDYDSARVYLANWSLGVKQEAERYQKQNKLFDSYRNNIFNDLNLADELNNTEINNALQRQFPLTEAKWNSLWDESDGRLRVTVNEVKDFIFHGGLENNNLREKVWGFLLEIYPWDSSQDERLQIDQTLAAEYDQLKLSWSKDFLQFDDEDEEEYWNDQLFRISKDVRRCDRNLDIFQYNTADALPPQPEESPENGNNVDNIESAGDESDETNNEVKNPHLIHLQSILITYNVYNTNLGYVQGMTDLLSPIYVIMRDEWKTFWCFTHFMDIMERNFLRDQSGIHEQMLTLVELVQLMLPELSEHLNQCDSGNLFFCFRMLLVWFKREFEMEDIMHIWENFWTFYYSSQFQLFFMLAILQKNSQAILQHLNQFDQILKFFNELNGKLDWNDLMVRAELLFKKFEKMMHVMERDLQNSSSTSSSSTGVLPCQSERLKLLLSKNPIIKHEGQRSKDSVK
ncbi:gyp7p [Saccharomyces arboricola H-6]|uniref:GTPase-activating protein GYP7 n=1 Tax=Saccharomyces arboricola (strain H-6 / AS 2.3317 / CBS 10644) TaxID=1160507 RepID=J8Q758_SACAR|nr:gyp7p [Saccharomyces arboricola H-6]